MLLQMALFHSSLWLSNILLCIYTTSSLSIHLSVALFLDSLGLETKQVSLQLVNVLMFLNPAHTLVKSPFTKLSLVTLFKPAIYLPLKL